MKIKNPEAWAAILDQNPLPEGCPVEAGAWLAWASAVPFEARVALYRARIILVAEWWADAMEDEIARGASVEACAARTFAAVNRPLGVFALSPFQRGLAIAALAACWWDGPRLHHWELRQAQAAEERAVLAPARG